MFKTLTISRVIIFLSIFSGLNSFGQSSSFFSPSDSLHKGRIIGVASAELAFMAGSYIGLQNVWYKNISKTEWHSFNDWPEWQQMDKLGHTFAAYSLGKASYDLFHWSGVNENISIALGGSYGFLYLLGFEMLDAQAQKWGFSWSDLAANGVGTGLFMGQQFLWGEQRFKLKFSAHPTIYAKYRPEALGDSFLTRLLKDYNGQTYWLSGNIASFLPEQSKFPRWLNFSLGYNAIGMTGGRKNIAYGPGGNKLQFQRKRRYLLSLDVDLSKIPVKKPWLKAILKLFNHVKVPFPAISFSKNDVNAHWFYF